MEEIGFLRAQWLWAELAVLVGAVILWLGERKRIRLLRSLLPDAELAELQPLLLRRRCCLAAFLAASALALAAAGGPFCGYSRQIIEGAGIDAVLVADLSASMNARDYRPSRLQAAKVEMLRLLEKLQGQRVGLVGFAGLPSALLPLTVDHTAARDAIDNLDTSAIPVPGTALGDGLRVGLDILGPSGGVLIVFSDGEDYHSEPLKAAQLAARRGVPVVCVGIGTEQGSTVPDPDDAGKSLLRDDRGQAVRSRLDAQTLRQIAELTGGCYIPLRPGSEGGLEAVMEVVRRCRTAERERREAQARRDCSGYLLLLALLVCGAGMAGYALILPDTEFNGIGQGGKNNA